MREHDLRKVLARLGVQPTGRRRSSGWIEFRCPLAPYTHAAQADTRPSAAAKVNDQGHSLWSCQTCKAHGRLTSLVHELQRYRHTFYEGLITQIDEADRAALMNAPTFEEVPFEVEQHGPKALIEEQFKGLYPAAGEDKMSRAYLQGRGITRATVEKLGLLYDPKQNRILFPVRGREGELYGFTGRLIIAATKSEPKVRDYHGLPKRDLVLGADRWRVDKPLIIVEGLFAFAHLHEIGVEQFANIGALLGSAMTPEKAKMIRNFDHPVYLLLDNDEAGDVGIFGRHLPDGKREDAAGALGQLKTHVPVMIPEWPSWPETTKYHGKQFEGGTAKDDPDQLTLDEVQDMLQWTGPS